MRCVKLGMHWYRAAMVAECTEEEMEALEQSPEFQKKVNAREAIQEMQLLEKHKSAMDEAAIRGSAGAIQWKLERINPSRWGKTQKDDESDAPKVVIVEIPGLENYINRDEPSLEEKMDANNEN